MPDCFKACQTGDLGAVATSTKSKPGKEEQTVKRPNHKFIGKCFRCQGPHLMRDCKEPRSDLTYFQCDQVGHISRHYSPHSNSQPFNSEKVPESLLTQIVVTINGKRAKTLVDTGCTSMLVMTGVADFSSRANNIRAVDSKALWRDWHQDRGKEFTTMPPSNCAG